RARRLPPASGSPWFIVRRTAPDRHASFHNRQPPWESLLATRATRLDPWMTRVSRSTLPARCAGGRPSPCGHTGAKAGKPARGDDMSEHVLEKEGQAFADATAKPPYLYEIGPEAARKVLDDVQAAPIEKVEVDESWVTVPAEVG